MGFFFVAGGMASGPCGPEFKEAFSCFHYSKEEMKGSDCITQFQGMQVGQKIPRDSSLKISRIGMFPKIS